MAQQKNNPLHVHHSSISGVIETEARFAAQPTSAQLRRTTRAARNGTLATATSLGKFPPGKREIKNGLSQSNSTDFFKIELTDKGRIKLVLTNRSEGSITASILDATGKVVSLNGQKQLVRVPAGTEAETLVKSADPGVYYLRFKSNSDRRATYEANLFVNRPGGPQPLPCGCED